MPSCGRGPRMAFLSLLLVLLLQSALITAQRGTEPSPWQTLTGNAPLLIARGGFSGLFPDSSQYAYTFALGTSLSDVLLWCDVKLTKDSIGICLPDVRMDNCTDIESIYPRNEKNYLVNGVPVSGWFSVDYNMDDLSKVNLIQGIFSRTAKFDDGMSAILTVEAVASQKPQGLWLNIQHDMFYRQHNLSMRSYVLSVTRSVVVDYVSSPEVAFLSSVTARFKANKTKLIFRILGTDITEPSTNQTYGSLLKNLTFIKTFASGILIPKDYIWPVTADLYLQPHTSVVLDAHKAGLEVFASDFANDNLIAYNYSYDPIAEYLFFLDNGDFSVDGILSDSPTTASEAIGCFSHINKTGSGSGSPIVISHNGASGVYPGCTDLAYKQALDDGADFIDCPVQVTKDGILVCMNSINLIEYTTVTKSPFNTRSSIIPEIQSGTGIFTFNLTWQEIQKNVKPEISTPDLIYRLVRNPLYDNAGNFMTLPDFLAVVKGTARSGALIGIDHAAFLAEKMGFSVTDAVIKTLDDLGYNNQTDHQVMIQSTNSSVLMKLKQQTKYKLMYKVEESIGDAVFSSVQYITEFAHSIAINKQSVYPESQSFIVRKTKLVENLKAANLSVYVYLLRNEFVSQAWDFLSDPTVEINTFVHDAGVDGVITDFPGTASAYRRNACLNMGKNTPNYMLPVQPGGLLAIITPVSMPPALAPLLELTESDVMEPPLPPASLNMSITSGLTAGAPALPLPSGQPCTIASFSTCLAMLLGYSLLNLIPPNT